MNADEIEIDGSPQITVDIHGTDKIDEVVVIRDGSTIHTVNPGSNDVRFDYMDEAFDGNSYYYVRVIQSDTDEHGNRSHAWSSPIWVKKR